MSRAKQFLLCCIILFFTSFSAFSQSQKITNASFNVSGAFAKDADALVLLDSGYVYFDNALELYFKHTIQIHIINDNGKNWGKFQLPYTSKDSLIALSGKLYRQNEGRVLIRDLNSSRFTISKKDDNQIEASADPTELATGDIVEYSYLLKFGDWKNINEWYFQNDIPVLKSSFTTKIPSFILFYKFLEGVRNLDDMQRTIVKDTIQFEVFNMQRETFVMDSIPVYKEEDDVPGSEFFISKITYHLAEYTLPKQKTVFVLPESYMELAFNWASDPYFNQINVKSAYLQDRIDQLYHSTFTNEKNIQSFFFFVRNNFIIDNRLYDDDLEKTYKRGAGNEQQVNMLLAKMLNQAGFDAQLLAISTVDNRPVYPEFPYFELFNKFVVFVRTPAQNFFLDASDKNLLFNMLTPNSINNGALIVAKTSTGLVALEYLFDDREEAVARFEITDSATIAGNYKVKRDGYAVYAFDSQYLTNFRSYNDYIIETIFEHPNWNIIRHDVKEKFKENKEVNEELDYTRPFDAYEDGVFSIKPIVKNEFVENPFPNVDRQNPITLYTPLKRKGSFSYEIPDDYEIVSIPQSYAISLDEYKCDFKYQVTKKDNLIRIGYIIDVNRVIFMANEYEMLSDFFNKISKALNQEIKLKKN